MKTKEEIKAKKKEYNKRYRDKRQENYNIFCDNIENVFKEVRKTKLFELERIPPVHIMMYSKYTKRKNVNAFVKTCKYEDGTTESVMVFIMDNTFKCLENIFWKTFEFFKEDKVRYDFQKYHYLYFMIHELIHMSQKERRGWEKRTKVSMELEARKKGRYYIKKFFRHKFPKHINQFEKLSKKYLDNAYIGKFNWERKKRK